MLQEATLYLGEISETKPIANDDEEVNFEAYIPAGKYDMVATLSDDANRVYPAYYVYIEKMND